METISSYQAKTRLPQLLKRVAQGEAFTITQRGVPVAELIPIAKRKKEELQRAIKELEALAERHTLNGLNIRDMIEEGRR